MVEDEHILALDLVFEDHAGDEHVAGAAHYVNDAEQQDEGVARKYRDYSRDDSEERHGHHGTQNVEGLFKRA